MDFDDSNAQRNFRISIIAALLIGAGIILWGFSPHGPTGTVEAGHGPTWKIAVDRGNVRKFIKKDHVLTVDGAGVLRVKNSEGDTVLRAGGTWRVEND